MAKLSLQNPKLFFNRHLSWLQFNSRVLEEALDGRNPLLERVKFLAITASNMDEFVEVRVAGLLQQAEQGRSEVGPDGLPPSEVLARLTVTMHDFVDAQYNCWREQLVPALAEESIRVRSVAELNTEARRTVDAFYSDKVEPILTPVTVDPAHPFPRVLNIIGAERARLYGWRSRQAPSRRSPRGFAPTFAWACNRSLRLTGR